MIALRRLGPGVYATLDGRYQIEHQDGLTDCEHPLCDTLHRKWHEHTANGYGADWVHMVPYRAWHVWDVEADDYATRGPEEFDTKRQAHQWLTDHSRRTFSEQAAEVTR